MQRVDWQMGQMLLPHHMVSQEESVLGHLKHVMKQLGLPFYGISRLHWDETLFAQGIISLLELSIIFPSGQIVDISKNASLTSFDLNSTEKSDITLYLHILEDTIQKEEEIKWDEDTAKITFALQRVVLSHLKTYDLSKEVFEIGRFEKSPENEWKLNTRFIPPLLNLTADPFLSKIFTKISALLESGKKKLIRGMENAELFAFQNTEWRMCLLEIARIQRFFRNILEEKISFHPFFLYEKLCLLLDCSLTSTTPTYDHDQLSGLFEDLFQKLQHLFVSEQNDLSCIEFEKFSIEALPKELGSAKDIYLIVQKPETHALLSLQSFKLASRLRMTHVRHFSLPGIPLLPIKKPAFLNSRFAAEVEVFVIEQKEEWKKALSEGNLVVFHPDITLDFHFFLYWRKDGSSQ